jgi:pimeloyl-ACP methyl ester carboxylesterase
MMASSDASAATEALRRGLTIEIGVRTAAVNPTGGSASTASLHHAAQGGLGVADSLDECARQLGAIGWLVQHPDAPAFQFAQAVRRRVGGDDEKEAGATLLPSQLVMFTVQPSGDWTQPYDPAAIKVPALLVKGELDADTPSYMAQALFPLLANAPAKQYLEIGEGTHSIMLEQTACSCFARSRASLTGRRIEPIGRRLTGGAASTRVVPGPEAIARLLQRYSSTGRDCDIKQGIRKRPVAGDGSWPN